MEKKLADRLFITHYAGILKLASHYPMSIISSINEVISEQYIKEDASPVKVLINYPEFYEVPIAIARCMSIRMDRLFVTVSKSFEVLHNEEINELPIGFLDIPGMTEIESSYLLPKGIYDLYLNMDEAKTIKTLIGDNFDVAKLFKSSHSEAFQAMFGITDEDYVRLSEVPKAIFEHFYLKLALNTIHFLAKYEGDEKKEYRRMALDLLNEGKLEDMLNLLKTFDFEVTIEPELYDVHHENYEDAYKTNDDLDESRLEKKLNKLMDLFNRSGIKGKAMSISVKEGETKAEFIQRLKDEEVPEHIINDILSSLGNRFKGEDLVDLNNVSNN